MSQNELINNNEEKLNLSSNFTFEKKSQDNNQKPSKILIIDDHKSMIKLLSRFFETRKLDRTVSDDRISGLQQIYKQNFDAVLLDLAMPEFSGWDVIEALEKKGKIKEERIFVFTASAVSSSDIEELLLLKSNRAYSSGFWHMYYKIRTILFTSLLKIKNNNSSMEQKILYAVVGIAALEKEDLLKDQRTIIFTTSSITNGQIQALLEKDGVESCLRKPVQLSELITTITAGI